MRTHACSVALWCFNPRSKTEGKPPGPSSVSPEDTPTASFGILSIDAYRKSFLREEREHPPVVVACATLNLLTMQADDRYNTPAEYDAVMDTIRGLVPYFTREYLVAYATRFVKHKEKNTWKVCGVQSSTSIFVSQLRPSPGSLDGGPKYELIEELGGRGAQPDIRLEDYDGTPYQLPNRPRSCSTDGGWLEPPMDYSFRECVVRRPYEPTREKKKQMHLAVDPPSGCPLGCVPLVGLCPFLE